MSTSAVGTQRITKIANEPIYTVFRPTAGISLKGANIRGPRPYAKTYSASPREAADCETPNRFMTPLYPYMISLVTKMTPCALTLR